MKRLLSLFLCVLLMVSSITPAFAAQTDDVQVVSVQSSESATDAA